MNYKKFTYSLSTRNLFVYGTALLIIVLASSSINAPERQSHINGASITGYSSGCQSCHTSSTTGYIVLTGLPKQAIAGTQYPITVRISDAVGKRWGFDMSTTAGTLTTTNPNAAVTSGKNVHHGSAAPVKTDTSYSFDNIIWTAPATATTTVTFKFAGLAANNNGSSSGDHAYKNTVTTAVIIATPVNLASFTATTSGTAVALNWVTASELNADYFEIEKSIDGISFGGTAKVTAAGNSTSIRKYVYADASNDLIGALYYRLKLVDKDGSYTYSAIEEVNVKAASDFISSVYPNPVKAGATIQLRYTASKATKITLQLIDLSGRKLTLNTSNVSEGANTISIKTGYVAPSLYYLTTIANDNTGKRVPVIIQ